jgi:hypothetical protein
MSQYYFDEFNRFVIEDYSSLTPFASFLPSIAGPMGVPLWVCYVNRGQAIASFGVESKDKPAMEFQPANKAYQTTPLTGFRTFIKIQRSGTIAYYEPFSAIDRSGVRWQQMHIAANELELQDGRTADLTGSTIGAPYAASVRAGQVKTIHALLGSASDHG